MKVDMKVVDDKLKIIDEVPSSAVEMSVKEKVIINIFLFSLHVICIWYRYGSGCASGFSDPYL